MDAILVIEDDRTFARIVEGFLTKLGYAVTLSGNGKDGIERFREGTFSLVLMDFRLPDTTGYDLLVKMKADKPDVPVILMTSFTDLRTAVRAIKAGAFEYITKPINPDELQLLIAQALQKRTEPKTGKPKTKRYVEGSSAAAKKMYEYISVVAPTEMTVILEGESGTGKENAAQTIHSLSKRAAGPFVAVDCGALSKELAGSELFGHVKGAFTGAVANKTGQFETANGGTLFLDEVGNLSYDVQVKLLRAIQERVIQPLGSTKNVKVDVRIITATNENLLQEVKSGTFREDLYHRLNEFKIQVPALRERSEDLELFIDFFREEANQELNRNVKTFDDEVVPIFKTYDWPGNLRELKNTIRRAVLLTPGEVVKTEVLPPDLIRTANEQKTVTIDPQETGYDLKALQEKQEREMIIRTLEEVRYNKAKAARLLNIDRKTLYLKMEKYNIH